MYVHIYIYIYTHTNNNNNNYYYYYLYYLRGWSNAVGNLNEGFCGMESQQFPFNCIPPIAHNRRHQDSPPGTQGRQPGKSERGTLRAVTRQEARMG